MMFNLIYKELRLAAHPTLFVFVLLGALVIIPSYPYGVVFLFGCLAVYNTFVYGRETNDVCYTVLLPIRKDDVVKAKCLLMVSVQLVQLLVSVPFAVLRAHVSPKGNVVGIEANVAYYGFGLLIYAIFNFIMLTLFFKTAYKAGVAFLCAIVPIAILIAAMETLVHIPGFAWLDSISQDMLIIQLPVLIVGSVIYVVLTLAAYAIAARRFDKVDL
jgi:hypothetical protein